MLLFAAFFVFVGLISANHQYCGTPTVPPPGSRIVGGSDVTPYEVPWQVGLLGLRKTYPFCGGTLISHLGKTFVLTAQHCVTHVKNPRKPRMKVRLGAHARYCKSTSDLGCSGMEEIEVSRVIMHPKYDAGTFSYDAALLKLKKTVMFKNHIRPACLPQPGDQEPPPNTSCTISGFGTLQSGGSVPKYLQKATVNLISGNDCQSKYPAENIDVTMLCASKNGIDTCQGDSGGPLVCPDMNGRYHIWGATSWGYGCAHPDYPGVYTRVSHVIDWIKREINTTDVSSSKAADLKH